MCFPREQGCKQISLKRVKSARRIRSSVCGEECDVPQGAGQLCPRITRDLYFQQAACLILIKTSPIHSARRICHHSGSQLPGDSCHLAWPPLAVPPAKCLSGPSSSGDPPAAITIITTSGPQGMCSEIHLSGGTRHRGQGQTMSGIPSCTASCWKLPAEQMLFGFVRSFGGKEGRERSLDASIFLRG